MTIDLDRITHPLRLAAGSHQPGSGKGCAMNVISYINGDSKITDYPECSARPLSRLVQRVNDLLAGPDGFLSPENSVVVLDLGWQTVGTAGAPREVVWRWLADLLVDPEWGVVKHARRQDTEQSLRRVAALCVREANGERVSAADWTAARRAAYEERRAAYADAYAAAAAAAYAAAYAAAAAYADADAYAAAAAYAAAYAYAAADAAAYADAYAAAYADARVEFTRRAIQRWRELAGLDSTSSIDTADINAALDRIHA